MTEDDGEKQEKKDIFRSHGGKSPGARADRPASARASGAQPEEEGEGFRETQNDLGTTASGERITSSITEKSYTGKVW